MQRDTTFNNWEKMERTASCVYYVYTVFRKTNISNPPIRTHSCSYQGVRNVSFSENFAYLLNGWSVTKMRPYLASIIIKYQEYRNKTSQVFHNGDVTNFFESFPRKKSVRNFNSTNGTTQQVLAKEFCREFQNSLCLFRTLQTSMIVISCENIFTRQLHSKCLKGS